MIENRMKERREALGLSQAELARRTYVTQQCIGLYELGKRQPVAETLRALADALECTTDYLLGRSDEIN